MNLLLFSTDELAPGNRLRVDVARAVHLLGGGKLELGQQLRVGEENGRVGTGCVVELSPSAVWLEVTLEREVEQLVDVDLVLALPRPQMLKRIFQTAACIGVRNLYLVGAERVEKSFFSSSSLKPETVQHHLRLGLEQGMRTRLPRVEVQARLHEFLDSTDKLDCNEKFIADGRAERSLDQVFSTGANGIALAIGPEGGWRLNELRAFENKGFVSCQLGASVLSVEVAVAVALGQIELLRSMSVRAS